MRLKLPLFIIVVFITTQAVSQTISQAFFDNRQEFYKKIDKNKLEKEKLTKAQQEELKTKSEKRAKFEKTFVSNVFRKYQRIAGLDLDTAQELYLLKRSRDVGDNMCVFWTTRDTVIVPITDSPLMPEYINPGSMKFKLTPFYNLPQDVRSSLLNQMDIISNKNIPALEQKIALGSKRLILDGPRNQLFIFNKELSNYKVIEYFFRSL